MGLEKYSIEQLLAEVQRRLRQDMQDWYFIPDWDKSADDFYIGIVHKRYWHLHHRLDTRPITSFLKLPENCSEVSPGLFCFDSGTGPFYRSMNHVHRVLTALGFEEHPYEPTKSGVEVVQEFDVQQDKNDTPFQALTRLMSHVVADSEPIKFLLENVMKESFPKKFVGVMDYWEWMNRFAKDYYLHIEWKSDYEVALLQPMTYRDLPAYPDGYEKR